MILADTNILSTFARIGRLDLLFAVVKADTLYLPPSVTQELQAGLNKGLEFLRPLLDALADSVTFTTVNLTDSEGRFLRNLPDSLNAGEREGIAICAFRTGTKFLTNDKRAHNYCQANGIPSINLPLILRELWESGLCSKDEVRSLIEVIERNETGMTIKNQREIW